MPEPSRDEGERKRRKNKLNKIDCVPFLLSYPGWYVHTINTRKRGDWRVQYVG